MTTITTGDGIIMDKTYKQVRFTRCYITTFMRCVFEDCIFENCYSTVFRHCSMWNTTVLKNSK